jgi:hypothetical protein
MTTIPSKDELDPDERQFFQYGATLRIVGHGMDFQEISEQLGIQPTYTHQEGDQYAADMWCYSTSLDGLWDLDFHLKALRDALAGRKSHLRAIKRRYNVDIFCVYDGTVCHAGSFYIAPENLQMFTELEIAFGVLIYP